MPSFKALVFGSSFHQGEFSNGSIHFSQQGDEQMLPGDIVEYQLLLINLEEQQQDKLLTELRSNNQPNIRNKPVFVVQASGLSPYLADGLWQPEQLEDWLQQFQQRDQQLLIKDSLSPADKLLSYAWPRINFCLKSHWQAAAQSNYHYPLLEVLGIGFRPDLLQQWQQAELLEKQTLVDRVRQCVHCSSQQINYVDVCPSCKAIDIESTISLHCFTCGHVGEQREFQLDTALRCPTCTTQLRHIGVDYDRPLERFKCNSCDHGFIEGEVIAKCQSCAAHHSPAELKELKIYDYGLGNSAYQIATIGRVFDNRALQWGEQATVENFSWLVRWNNDCALRHKHCHVVLFISWSGIAESIVNIGEEKTMAQVGELQSRLQAVIRKTDVFTEVEDDKAMILLCHTSLKWIDIFSEKLAAIEQANKYSILKLEVRSHSLPDETLPEDTRKWLLTHSLKMDINHVA